MDVIDLRDFYNSPLGRTAAVMIASALKPMVAIQPGQVALGLGYALPYFERLMPEDATALAFMPARLGVIHWPREGQVRSALVEDADLPLLESVADMVLVAHGLEHAEQPLEMLQEIWRVLQPQGKLYLVVPNRISLWSATDTSPFGHGQPFSRGQLARLLKEAQFSALQWRHALFIPPLQRRSLVPLGRSLERAGALMAKRFSGVIIVEAVKQVYAIAPGRRSRRFVPQFKPVLLPAPRPAGRLGG